MGRGKQEGGGPPRRRVPARADSRAIVDAILTATADLAAEDIEGVSMAAIARRAGVGPASLHRYFPDKRAIYAELAKRRDRRMLEELQARLEPDTTVEQMVRAAVHVLLDTDPKRARLRKTLNVDIPKRWILQEAHDVDMQALDLLTAWLRAHLPRVPDDVEARVFAADGAARGVVMLRLTEPDRAPSDDWLGEQLVSMLLHCLGQPGGRGVGE